MVRVQHTTLLLEDVYDSSFDRLLAPIIVLIGMRTVWNVRDIDKQAKKFAFIPSS